MTYPVRDIDENLLQYCTERQRQVLLAIRENGGLNAAARALGINRTVPLQTLRDVKKKAAAYGYSPEYDLTKPIAPGFMARGHSTAYDMRKPGQPAIIQWVKTQRDDKAQEEVIRAAIAALMDDVERAKPIALRESCIEHLCNVYTLTDCHVGLHAWGKQTGDDWDLGIAESVLTGAFSAMVDASPKAQTAVVAQLGDFLHFDSLIPETPTSRNPLDADSRYSKVVRVAVRVMRNVIDLALAKHKRVLLLIAEGNHDLSGSVWLRQMFELLYEHEPRIEVIDSELPYYCFQHGQTMLGWHHGHMRKPDQLPAIFAAQFPKVWGETTKRYIHVGHLHHVSEKEHSGVKVFQHPTLAARDAWAARGGWISERQVTAVTYSSKFGEVSRNTITPEMILID